MSIELDAIVKKQIENFKNPINTLLRELNVECKECGDTGYVTTMERVYSNEPHMADIGEKPCPFCNERSKHYDRGEPSDDYHESK